VKQAYNIYPVYNQQMQKIKNHDQLESKIKKLPISRQDISEKKKINKI
jgi:hypothetical protein